MANDVLHIYGQRAQHDDITIAGTPDALDLLASLIRIAIAHHRKDACTEGPFFVNDGEGYNVRVIVTDEPHNLVEPYTADFAEDHREVGTFPWLKHPPREDRP